MSQKIIGGSTSQSVVVRIVDSADGTPEEAVTKDTAGLSIWYRRAGGVVVAATPDNDLATADAAWVAKGIIHLDDGYYRYDPPDAAFANGVASVLIGGTATDMVVIGALVTLEDGV